VHRCSVDSPNLIENSSRAKEWGEPTAACWQRYPSTPSPPWHYGIVALRLWIGRPAVRHRSGNRSAGPWGGSHLIHADLASQGAKGVSCAFAAAMPGGCQSLPCGFFASRCPCRDCSPLVPAALLCWIWRPPAPVSSAALWRSPCFCSRPKGGSSRNGAP